MANITVAHYLNKKLKPTTGVGEYKNELAFPVYIRISYGRKNQRIKSCWIHFDVTEREFKTGKRVREVIEYETSIIYDIFKYQQDDVFDISTKLRLYLKDIINHYVGWVIMPDEIANFIRTYICQKANIKNEHILNPYISYRDIEDYYSDDWYELVEKEVFPSILRDKVLYLALLLDFQSSYYKNDTEDYEVGNVLNYHEWKNRGAKKAFLLFAENRHILDECKLLEITKIFDECLKNKIHTNWFVMDEELRNCKKK